ncbi:MAG: ChuX/HutX family heme-like substrate-binding protein [Aquabacterium sp.]
MPHQAIRTGFRQARQTPRSRHRDIAQAMGISEGELVAAHCGTFDTSESPLRARRLQACWPDIIAALPQLGDVMALTRNEHCVHEKIGTYDNVSAQGPQGQEIGLALGKDIDLRLFYGRWAHGFAVQERLHDDQWQRSLQFFDAHGTAIHKVFLKPQSNLVAYAALTERFGSPDATVGIEALPPQPAQPEKPDGDIDVAGFQQAWTALRDTHEFFGMLRRFGVSRTQALRLAPQDYAHPLSPASAFELLNRAAQQGVSIMVFVGNPGLIQIHTGPVKRIEVMGPWVNVLDEGFNLHLREDRIASAWLVKKPTVDGLVHSLELFDAQGETIAMLFGERKPGRAELCEWRQILAPLTPEVEPCAA